MKKLAKSLLTILLAVIMAALPAAQVLAAATPDYISEVKVYFGDYSAAVAEGFTLLKIGNDPVDLNQDAGGGFGSKGDVAVYLGYKTTKDKDDAITDLALMNMRGGYSVKDYETLMENQMKAQIVPLVDTFLAAINEYRENYKAGVQRAVYINGVLNKFIDDDTGKGLGDLFLNETIYEMAKPRYDALSEEQRKNTTFYSVNNQVRNELPEGEKKNHADILTIIAQSNGRATLMMLNLLTRAADTNDSTWLERFAELDLDKLEASIGLPPTDAKKQLAKLYDDSANTLLDLWDDMRNELLAYDECKALVESYDSKKMQEIEAKIEKFTNLGTDPEDDELIEAMKDYQAALEAQAEMTSALKTILIHDTLDEMEYDDGTLLDFFTQSHEDIEDDITLLYPLAASFTKGQRAGLEYISLKELLMIALSDDEAYMDSGLDDLDPVSIYDGVDRSIYEKDAVALTSDSLRADFSEQVEEENGIFSPWTIASWVITGGLALAAITTAGIAIGFKAYANYCVHTYHSLIRHKQYTTAFEFLKSHQKVEVIYDQGGFFLDVDEIGYDEIYNARVPTMKWIAVGFTVAMVILAAVSVYLTYRDLQAHYNVAFTPIPHYMVDEKDLISYNSKGEKVVMKNQSAYYKAVQCNRAESAEFFKVLDTCADLNGDVGRQWLALYAVKKELMNPILAASLKAVVNDARLPAGYETGIHMFGSDVAFNLNSSLYDWANSAPGVYVYFQTDDAANANSTASVFTAGTLALTGVTGIALGAGVTTLFMKKKKRDAAAAED